MVIKTQSCPNTIAKKILIVDDHPVMRYGLMRTLGQEPGITVCGEAEDDKSAIRFIEELRPDLVILDISLGNSDGLVLTRIIHTRYPGIAVLILSMHDETIYARKALRAGALGYIMKDESSERLVDAVRDVLRGDVYVSNAVRKNMLKILANAEENQDALIIDQLSNRERQVFMLIGDGFTTSMIANKLCLSSKTVDTHRARIKQKLDINSMPELVLTAKDWIAREGFSPSLVSGQ